MMAGHMDEIGFMVRHITKEEFIKFVPLGGWFDQVLSGQRVLIRTREGEVVGVIGVKPPHLLSAEERAKVVTRKEMYIDIGACSDEDVKAAGVRGRGCHHPASRFCRNGWRKSFAFQGL